MSHAGTEPDFPTDAPAWQQLRDSLRPGQQSLADWRGGPLAVSAVPGSGKSTGMAAGAALAIARYRLHAQHQLVAVTFTRSAAASLKGKIRDCLQALSLPAGGFVVRTLHGLALNIATRHPELSGWREGNTVIAPQRGHPLIRTCVEQWIAANPHRYQTLLEGDGFDGEDTERLRRQSALRTEVLPDLARTAVLEAKSAGLLPEALWQLGQHAPDEYRILEIAAGLAQHYQQLLQARECLDYQDMILAALRVMDDPVARRAWQARVFAVFEDEAQDSSPLQEQLLRILAASPDGSGKAPNLVRIGDPNQAINATFTPADPYYFNAFCQGCEAQQRLATLDRAGRSSDPIMAAANVLPAWVNRQWQRWHPGADPPFRAQAIQPVEADDPQAGANPPPIGSGLELHAPSDIHGTVERIGERVPEVLDGDTSAAVLVREHRQARFVRQQLQFLQRSRGIRVFEAGEAERDSPIPAEILHLLQFLQRPHSPERCKGALTVLRQRDAIGACDLDALAAVPEQFLYPTPLEPSQSPRVAQAARYCRNLLQARSVLPPYQLISFLGLTLRYAGTELATVQKLAERIARQTAGDGSLACIVDALGEIVTAEQFQAIEGEGDDRYTRPGQLTIMTMHKAKGLDWDCVFLPFLHARVLPGSLHVPAAAQFLGGFTLSAVAKAQIRTAVRERHTGQAQPLPPPEAAWAQARQLKQAEEYRLLYVAMTRAKRLLWMGAAQQGPFSWSRAEPSQLQPLDPCPALTALWQQFPQAVCD